MNDWNPYDGSESSYSEDEATKGKNAELQFLRKVSEEIRLEWLCATNTPQLKDKKKELNGSTEESLEVIINESKSVPGKGILKKIKPKNTKKVQLQEEEIEQNEKVHKKKEMCE